MKILSTNLCTESGTTVSASSADTNFPASNLQHPFRSKRWRATGCASETVVFDFQTAEAVNTVVILWPKEDGIRLTEDAVVKIQANATNVWTSPTVNQTLTIDNDYSVASHHFSTDQSYRYWRVVVEDAGNPWAYVELGVVWIGKSLAVENAQNGFSYDLTDRSRTFANEFGHEYVDEYPQTATLTFSYQYLDYSAIQTLENAYRTNGNRKPVLVVLDPDETVFNKDHLLVYGKMSNRFGFKHVSYNLANVEGIAVEELS